MFSVTVLIFDGFVNKTDTLCIQSHKFEKSLEIWLFSVFHED